MTWLTFVDNGTERDRKWRMKKKRGQKRPRCRPNKANTLGRFLSVSSSQVFVLYSTKFKDIRISRHAEEFNILNEKG